MSATEVPALLSRLSYVPTNLLPLVQSAVTKYSGAAEVGATTAVLVSQEKQTAQPSAEVPKSNYARYHGAAEVKASKLPDGGSKYVLYGAQQMVQELVQASQERNLLPKLKVDTDWRERCFVLAVTRLHCGCRFNSALAMNEVQRRHWHSRKLIPVACSYPIPCTVQLSVDFNSVATVFGRIIISEMFAAPQHQTLAKQNLGGVAGGQYFFVLVCLDVPALVQATSLSCIPSCLNWHATQTSPKEQRRSPFTCKSILFFRMPLIG